MRTFGFGLRCHWAAAIPNISVQLPLPPTLSQDVLYSDGSFRVAEKTWVLALYDAIRGSAIRVSFCQVEGTTRVKQALAESGPPTYFQMTIYFPASPTCPPCVRSVKRPTS